MGLLSTGDLLFLTPVAPFEHEREVEYRLHDMKWFETSSINSIVKPTGAQGYMTSILSWVTRGRSGIKTWRMKEVKRSGRILPKRPKALRLIGLGVRLGPCSLRVCVVCPVALGLLCPLC